MNQLAVLRRNAIALLLAALSAMPWGVVGALDAPASAPAARPSGESCLARRHDAPPATPGSPALEAEDDEDGVEFDPAAIDPATLPADVPARLAAGAWVRTGPASPISPALLCRFRC